MKPVTHPWPLAAILLVSSAASTASALPTQVSVTPPGGARFLEYQRFDLRVEGKGTAPFSATLAVDGVPQAFSSATDPTTTDGITSAGWGGFDLRGYAFAKAGNHVLTATFTDATGTVTVSSTIQVLPAFGKRDGGRGKHTVKNIILMVGDGMGVAHRTAARLVKYGVTGGQPDGWLAMDRFPGTGLITTHSLNSIITDSAPGMACYASGSHVNNGQEGVFPAHVTNPFFQPRIEYMSEYLHRVKGTALGLVTTADVEDATPAANAVHTGNRNAGTGVCDQYLDESDAENSGAYGTGLKVLMGGGRRWFLPSTTWGSSRAGSTDYGSLPPDLRTAWGLPATGGLDPNRDLITDFEHAGFAYADSKSALDALSSGTPPDRLLGLFAYGNMNVALDKIAARRGQRSPATSRFIVDDYHAPDQPMLDEMTDAAIKILARDRDGFVLMVEGAHIDKQSHLMDADRAVGETIEFDNAVAVARKWADRLGDTVVLVLADHECSGFSLIGALSGGVASLGQLPAENTRLDPATVPARQSAVGTYDAAGFPRYQILADGYPATMDVDGKLLVGYGASADRYEGWLSRPLPVIDSLLPSNIKSEMSAEGYAATVQTRAESAFGFYLRGQVPGDQAVHTASDIPVSAYSSTSRLWQQFVGVQTNTDVFFKLMRAAVDRCDDD